MLPFIFCELPWLHLSVCLNLSSVGSSKKEKTRILLLLSVVIKILFSILIFKPRLLKMSNTSKT